MKKIFSGIGVQLPPHLIAYGICLGLFAGFLPFGVTELWPLALLTLMVLTRPSIGFIFVVGAVVQVVMGVGLWRLVAATGRILLETESLQGMWSSLLDIPVIRLFGFERYRMLGGFVWATVMSVVIFFPACKFGHFLRFTLIPKLGASKGMGLFVRSPIGWFTRLFFTGARPVAGDIADSRRNLPKADSEAAKAEESPAPASDGQETAASEDASAPESAKPDAKPAEQVEIKQPSGVHWWLVLPLLITAILFELVFGSSLLGYVTKTAAEAGMGYQVKLADTTLKLLGGKLEYQNFEAEQAKEQVASLETAVVDMDMSKVLKGSLTVRRAQITNPVINLKRSTETEPAPVDTTEPTTPTDPRDSLNYVLDNMEEWSKQAEEARKQYDEYIKQQRAAAEGPTREEKRQAYKDRPLMGSASYMKQRPLAHVEEMICNGLTINIEDSVQHAKPFQLTEGHLELRNLTTDPRLIDKPLEGVLTAKVSGFPTSSLVVNFGHNFVTSESFVNVEFKNIPMEILDPYFQNSFPLAFGPGTKATLLIKFTFNPREMIADPVVTFSDLNVSERNPGKGEKIAGVEAARVAKELNSIKTITLDDVKIRGSIGKPKIIWGNSLKQLAVQGAQAYARNKADEAINQGKTKLQEQVGKGLDSLGKKLSEKGVTVNTGDNPVDDTAKKLADDAKNATKGVLDNLFGGSKKKSEDK